MVGDEPRAAKSQHAFRGIKKGGKGMFLCLFVCLFFNGQGHIIKNVHLWLDYIILCSFVNGLLAVA